MCKSWCAHVCVPLKTCVPRPQFAFLTKIFLNRSNYFWPSVLGFVEYTDIYIHCDGKLTKIPKWDFIFARVKTGQVGT